MTEDSHEFTEQQLIDDIEKLTENIKASFEPTIESVSSFLSLLDEACYSSGKWWLDQIEANITEKERSGVSRERMTIEVCREVDTMIKYHLMPDEDKSDGDKLDQRLKRTVSYLDGCKYRVVDDVVGFDILVDFDSFDGLEWLQFIYHMIRAEKEKGIENYQIEVSENVKNILDKFVTDKKYFISSAELHVGMGYLETILGDKSYEEVFVVNNDIRYARLIIANDVIDYFSKS